MSLTAIKLQLSSRDAENFEYGMKASGRCVWPGLWRALWLFSDVWMVFFSARRVGVMSTSLKWIQSAERSFNGAPQDACFNDHHSPHLLFTSQFFSILYLIISLSLSAHLNAVEGAGRGRWPAEILRASVIQRLALQKRTPVRITANVTCGRPVNGQR